MKKLLYLIILFIYISQPAQAMGLEDILPRLFVDGIDLFLEKTANRLYEFVGINNSNSQALMTSLLAKKNTFLEGKAVQKNKNMISFWYLIFYILFICVGGILVMHETSNGMGNDDGVWKTKYINVVIFAPLVWAFYLYGLDWIFSLEQWMSAQTYIDSMDLSGFASSNALIYFINACTAVLIFVLFTFRYLIISIIASGFLIIIGFMMIEYIIYGGVGSLSTLILKYGLLMLFSRFIMAFIIWQGTAMLSDVSGSFPVSSTILLLLIIMFAGFVGWICLLYPVFSLLIHTTKIFIMRKV